jgi:hypothetical protein
MDLRKIVSQILKEDAPIGGTQPAPKPAAKFYDVLADFQNFERTIDKQTEAAKKQLEATLIKNVGKKKVAVRASKGAMGQAEQDYVIDVKAVSISYLKDEYYIILKDMNGKDYYVNTAFKIKVIGDTSVSTPAANQPGNQKSEPPVSGKGSASPGGPRMVTGMAAPQNMGIAAGGPNTLSSK